MTGADRPLRYLLFATHVPRSGAGGGVVRYTVGLAEALARRADVELHVLTAGRGTGYFDGLLPPRRVHRLPGLPTSVLSVLERVGLVPGLRAGRFDVVHGTKHIVPRTAAGARRMLTVHDMLLFDRARDYPVLKRLLLRGPYRASLANAEVLVAVSRATVARLVDHEPILDDRVVAVPLAASPALTRAVPEPVAALRDTSFALVVGDGAARKNLALAVGTWKRVRVQLPGAVLVVVGPTPWGAEDHGGAVWDELTAEGAAVALRGISDGALRWCYENAAVVLCPSLLEGFGLPTVEATALGTPVVTSEDPALCEARAGRGRAAASWSRDDWVDTVVDTMRGADDSAVPTLRTWDDVAAETVRAARGCAVTARAAARAERVGVSPYRAPVHVRHLLAAGDEEAAREASRLASAHRDRGWRVEIETLDEPARATGRVHRPGPSEDVVVLHGLSAGRARRWIRGSVPTVVLAGSRPPRTPLGWAREARLARFTNVLALPADAGPGWTRVHAPVTRIPTTGLDADEAAAVFVRALAWGVQPTTR